MYLIPWLAFFLLWAIFIRYGLRLRIAFLAAQVVNGLLIVLATEALSVFQALSQGPLLVFWSLVVLAGLSWWHALRHRQRLPASPFVPFDAMEIAVLAAIGLIVAVTGVIALVAPPNNYDSLIYHMARVAHWAYNGTVANYPTNMLRQLVYPPYSEFAILQSYILSGSDRFANLVQWNSMVASLVGVSLLAEMLGGARRAQLFAVLFAATFPMGILQASSTQNDYVATFWAVCVVVFAMLLVTTGCRRWGVLLACSFGLAFFTKGIAVIVAAPFVAWALWKVRWPVGQKIGLLLLGIVTVFLINAAFLCRLTELSPNPYRAMVMAGEAVAMEGADVWGTFSNAIRGVATALAAPIPGWNQLLRKVVEGLHRSLGIGWNDPRFTFTFSSFSMGEQMGPVLDEDLMTSWIHSLAYLLVVVYIVTLYLRKVWSRRGRSGVLRAENVVGDGHLGYFMAVFVVAVLLFCSFFKWQEWIPRFHLPFFVIFSAVAGVVLDRSGTRLRLSLLVGAMMVTAAVVPLLCYPQRPLLPCGAVTKSSLAKSVARGGEIFDWLMRNGFFIEKAGAVGYLNAISKEMRECFRQAYPAEYETVWSMLGQALSFPRGILFASREELLFGRFSKVDRDAILDNVQFMRRQLARSPDCQGVGFIAEMEYPFWRLLNTEKCAVRIESALVDNVSRYIPHPRGELDPCFVVKEGKIDAVTMTYRRRHYVRCSPGPLQVYVDGRRLPPECRGVQAEE